MKTIKKIIAIGTGTLMLGATLTGALAQSLADYPEPFITDGRLDNTVIVVGEDASTSDVLGAIDIAASLQSAATSPVEGGASADPTISEGVAISKAGNDLNYLENISSIDAEYSDDDLDMLADGVFEEEDFEQRLSFAPGAGQFIFAGADEVDDYEFEAGDFMLFEDGQEIYTYTFELDDEVTFDEEDEIETETIDIQGSTYTISDIQTTTDDLTELTLLAGETTRLLYVDEPLTVGDDTITVVSTNEDEDTCLLNVNGRSVYVDVGETETVGGLTLGVTAAFASHSGENDACEVNVGAVELLLQDGSEVEVNGAQIEGSSVTLDGDSDSISGFTITYTMDEQDFENVAYGQMQYIAPGEAWVDPVFGNFKVAFADVQMSNSEEMEINSGTEDGQFTFNNVNGDPVTVDFFADGSDLDFGEEDAPLLYTSNSSASTDGQSPRIWLVLSNGEVHILEFDNYNEDDNELEFTDLTEDGTETATLTEVDGTVEGVTLGGLGTVELGYDEGDDTLFFDPTGNTAESENGAEIDLSESGDDAAIALVSPEEDSDVQDADVSFNVTLTYDEADDEIDVSAPSTASSNWVAQGVDLFLDNDDVQMYVSRKGIQFEYDADESTYLNIVYPEEDVYANVFLAPTSAEVVGGAAGGGAVQVNPFEVGLAVLDTDAMALNKNMIVVGGPCANAVAEDLMGVTSRNCAQDFEEGKAMLKMFDTEGNVALLVAGYDAQDTLNAAYVLVQHDTTYSDEFADLGDEVELMVSDLSNVQFNDVGTTSGTSGTGTGSNTSNTSGSANTTNST